MTGTLYGVGVGPGDPKLLTLLAVETLQNAHTIVVPDTGGENIALKIVGSYINGKKLLYCPMPMTRDETVLNASHQTAAAQITAELDKGLDLAFITLGDPTVYSTYMYIHRLVLQMGYTCTIINGIPSFCAAAARLNVSLCDKDQPLHILPSSYPDSTKMLSLPGNKVLMKSGKSLCSVVDALRQHHLLENAKMAECCYMENERLYDDLTNVTQSSYFSVILVKDKEH